MAVSKEHYSLGLIHDVLRGGLILPGSKWLILGNQRIRNLGRIQSIKPWLECFGAEVVMLDSNGKDGALPFDLNQHLAPDADIRNWSDIAANFGTTEHVYPMQYPVFKLIHDATKRGGLMLHAVPATDGCDGHGHWKYSLEWFNRLADDNGYHLARLQRLPVPHKQGPGPHEYIVAILRKSYDTGFVDESAWIDPARK